MESAASPEGRYRFGVFEADLLTGELWRKGLRVRLAAQPYQVLVLLLQRPGELLTREEIASVLWPDGTFVDYEHGVNSVVNRIREALGDKANSPRFIETLSKRGYRFVAPVERVDKTGAEKEKPSQDGENTARSSGILSASHELPKASSSLVKTLFVLLQLMYVGFYIGALANLEEINDLLAVMRWGGELLIAVVVTAAALIALRAFLLSALFFRAPGLLHKYLRLWPFVLLCDLLWAGAPFLLLHHINAGVALACTALLVYSPFAQRSLMLIAAKSE